MLHRFTLVVFLVATPGFAISQDTPAKENRAVASDPQSVVEDTEKSVKPGINDRFLDPELGR